MTAPTGNLYYVAASGSDDNPGTLDRPWRTVQHAADSLAPGDTVYIREGTYHEHVVIGRSGSPDTFITLAAFAGEKPTLDGQGFDLWNWGGVIDLSGQSYVRVSGLRVINSAYAGIFADGGDHLVVDHVSTYNTASSGIAFFDAREVLVDSNEVVWAGTGGEQEYITIAGTQNFEARYNHVHDYNPATGGKEGIDAKDGSANGSIHHNHVHDLDEEGIYVDAYSQHTYNIQVYANQVHDIAADGLVLAAEAGGLLENIRLENNLSYHNKNMGLRLSDCCSDLAATHPMTNIRIVNNTFYNNGWEDWGGGVYVINPNLTDVAIRNNIVSQNLSFQLLARDDVPLVEMAVDYNLIDGYRGMEGELYGQDYVEGDPLFVSAAEGNFHLQPDSPAIDGGAALDAPELDFDGNLRPFDGDEDGSAVFDIGAYEVAPDVPAELYQEQTFAAYTVRVYRRADDGPGYFEVLKHGAQIYRQEGLVLSIGHLYEEFNPPIQIGTDITADGVPDLVISEWAGGAHCCLEVYVFELGQTFHPIGQIHAGHNDQSHFEDLDGDGRLEFLTNDWTFAYWKTGFADSPAPPVILRFQEDGYHLATDLMSKPVPPEKELKKQAQDIQANPAWVNGQPPVALWAAMLDLIYSGHADLARPFFEAAWPAGVEGQEPFWSEFQTQLATSPYWQDLN